MKKKKMAIIGVGGRTGTIFAFELKNSADIFGVAREKEIDLIKEKNLYIERGNGLSELFDLRVIKDRYYIIAEDFNNSQSNVNIYSNDNSDSTEPVFCISNKEKLYIFILMFSIIARQCCIIFELSDVRPNLCKYRNINQ